jgi:hypothetical protein
MLLRPTVGIAPGDTIQFALGSWPGTIGIGVALSEEAFDTVEPHLRSVWPEWTPERRYGVTELPRSAASALVQLLRSELQSTRPLSAGSSKLFGQLADWLDAQRDSLEPVSILGV